MIEYTVGNWFRAQTIDEMQEFYHHRLPAIREAAYHCGYAIGVHGSMRRDMDLMAMPWVDSAADKSILAHEIALAACGIAHESPDNYRWEIKPCGRFATSICVCWTNHANTEFANMLSVGHIDLSVMEPVR